MEFDTTLAERLARIAYGDIGLVQRAMREADPGNAVPSLERIVDFIVDHRAAHPAGTTTEGGRDE